jgi:serine/threonine protein kinase/tetratricopeptide (TPR) repeat protein
LGDIHRSLAEAELLQSVAHCGRGVGATFYPREVETVMSDQPTLGGETWKAPGSESPGGRIGPFKILQLLGEGGFGSVFEAEQEQPVRRRVALKIIKLGMDTREVIARFEAERQALALMDHPHISRVLDAGATESGRPYFVMELVRGEPISSYCSKHNLSIVQRLQLFDQVCAAVQHAHTKGIIHRDLKPNNVLVSSQDDQPFAKVIDFGIAKATSGRLTDKTLFTEQFLMMGTPLYMSPEQAEGSADIDTRTDIYALGVILYELLTDTTPIDSHSLRSAGYVEVQRIIREVEPPLPSARLSKSIKTRMMGVEAKLSGDSRKLAKTLRGELDWIVMKAIEKDRTRRYETANGLAMDVRRYLAGEAVLAAPPGALYRMRKFVKRNKGTVAAGSLIAASLVAGIAGFAWQAHIAKARADELEQVSRFQATMLKQVNPTRAGKLLSDDVQGKFAAALVKADVPAAERTRQIAAFADQWQRVNATDTATDLIDRTILKPAAVAIDKQFKDQPLVAAALRQVLADRYSDMGLYDQALPLQQSALEIHRRELGADRVDTLDSIQGMGEILVGQGEYDKAEPFFREVLTKRQRILGEENKDTLTSIAELGVLLENQGKLDEAAPYFRKALAMRRRVLGEDNRDTVASISDMGGLLLAQGKRSEAEPYLREALEKSRRVLGEDDPSTLSLINNLGVVLLGEGKLDEAEPYLRESLEKSRRLLGEEHPDTLQSIVNLGGLLLLQGKLDEAEPYLREGMQKSRRVLGDAHANTLVSITIMGKLLVAQGNYAEAEKLLSPSEAAARKTLGGEAPRQFALFLLDLGKARTASREFATAQANLLEALSIYSKAHGANDKYARLCTQAIIDLYVAWNAAEPGKGYDAKAVEWKRKLAASGIVAPGTAAH